VRSYRRDWVGFFIAKMKQSKTADTAKQLKTRFLPHDYNARQDPKLIKLQIKHGLEGIGLYWCLVEMTWEQDNALEWDLDLIAYTLRTNADLVKSVAENFGLFKIKANVLSSDAIAKRMAYFDEKSQKAKAAAEMRWQSGRNANAMQTHSERNAINKEINKEINKSNKDSGDDFLSSDDFRTSRPPAKRPGPDYNKICDIFAQHGLIDMVAQEFYDSFWPLYKKGEIKDWEAYTEKAALKAEQKAYGMVRGHKPDPKYNPRG